MRLYLIMVGLFWGAFNVVGQGAEQYMDEVWVRQDVESWIIPFSARSEPIGRSEQVLAPVQFGDSYFLPRLKFPFDRVRPQVDLLKVGIGLGGYLESELRLLTDESISLAGGKFIPNPTGDGTVICAVWTGKKKKASSTGHAQIGVLDVEGKFTPFIWSDGISDDFNPVLADSGHKIYFHSNRAGGLGGMDIWMSEWVNGDWGNPVNLGEHINTSADEINPSLDHGGRLMFASNRIDAGFNGFNLLVWNGQKLRSLPYPINSNFDDLDISTGPDGQFWVASDRPTEAQRLMGPVQLFQMKPRKGVTVKTVHARHQTAIPNQPFEIRQGERILNEKTDENGSCLIYLDPGELIDLKVTRAEFDTLIVKSKSLLTPILLSMTEKNYTQVTIQVNENGKPAGQKTWVKFYRQGNLLDSVMTNEKGLLVRDLDPNSAYKMEVRLPGYQADVQTLSTGAKGKNSYSKTFNFGWREAEYVRWQARDAAGKRMQGVSMTILRDREHYSSVAPNLTDEKGFAGVSLPTETNFVLIGQKDNQFCVTTWKTRPYFQKIDTAEIILNMVPIQSGELLTRFQCPIEPFALQVGNFDEMHTVLYLLEQNPDLRVEVGVHTDTRGDADQNQRRSKQAAEFAMDFFISKGVSKERLKAKGFGESKPLNGCTDGINYSDQEHQENNRLEIRFI